MELSLRVFSDRISAVERSFRARIGAWESFTCQLLSYKASGRLQCNVETLIFRQGLLSVRDTVELSLRVFSESDHISEEELSFEHGSAPAVRQDRAHAS